MANTPGFVEHILELAAPAGRAAAHPMFGGHGVYVDGTIVAIVIDVLYFKTDERTRPAFVDAGLESFRYESKDGAVHTTSYFRAPDEALESPPAMQEWLRRALEAALRSAARKPRKESKKRRS
ncbi:MAG: TfoX/Sxy family protein [Betaproteobacteria bacterium]|nr:MAG: TfoX/Sxy family protein [Betaproteobacteria bacterium]